jgi:hypothetical protein
MQPCIDLAITGKECPQALADDLTVGGIFTCTDSRLDLFEQIVR